MQGGAAHLNIVCFKLRCAAPSEALFCFLLQMLRCAAPCVTKVKALKKIRFKLLIGDL
jgi:excinuclease UvrABC nuclease subunit